mmetsp:Transcript_14052/g.29678  ORF Transcript_14052/g.29678 Transcript_14052/m.29678 type:complete len:86 (+) Transcript_14052:95-352(+)
MPPMLWVGDPIVGRCAAERRNTRKHAKTTRRFVRTTTTPCVRATCVCATLRYATSRRVAWNAMCIIARTTTTILTAGLKNSNNSG